MDYETGGARFLFLKTAAARCVLLLCVVITVSCATLDRQRQQESFEDITEAYESAIRWGKYEVANSYRENQGADGEPDFEYLKKIKVTSYELKSVNISEDGNTVQQNAEIEYYKIDQFIEKTVIDRQLWKYDAEEKRWFLHSMLPDFE